jgi:hypothetical protein
MQRRRWISVIAAALLSAVLLLLISTQAMAVKVGDKAPDFSLPATTAEKISLSDYLGKKPLVIFSYLYAFSGG